MKRKGIYTFMFWLVVFTFQWASAQTTDYRFIDSVSRLMRASSPDQLVKLIAARYTNPAERTRAAFSWMTEHINYDVDGFYRSAKLYNAQWPSTVKDSAAREELFIANVANRVFNERKGICAGYSKLFMYLMKKLGVPVKSVEGFAKTQIEKTGFKFNANHEWNLVFIDNQWRPIDVTWAAGYTDFGAKKFHRDVNNHYFLTDPGLFLVDHYPAKKENGMLAWMPDFNQFITRPMVYRDFWKLNPTNFSASSGLYKFLDSAFTLNFTSTENIERLQIVSLPSNQQVAIYPTKGTTVYNQFNFVRWTEDGKIKIRYRPSKPNDKKAILFINGHAVMEFLIVG